MCNYQRILQPLIITSLLTQKHLNYHLKGTTSEKSAELYGEGNERQLCIDQLTLPVLPYSESERRYSGHNYPVQRVRCENTCYPSAFCLHKAFTFLV